jgi:hypothetical protein
MSQHDYILDNATGSAFRADLNNALTAIVTNNSGATAPSPTYAFQYWADTTSGFLKQRDGSNATWISIAPLAGLTASRAMITDSNGAEASSTVTSVELARLSGILSQAIGATDTQTISGKTFSDAPTFTQITTPTTPGAGLNKIYPKADGKFYTLDPAGTEVQVGAGGSSGINYLSANPDAESGTTGWATYADAGQPVPVDGTGGTATVTWTKSTSSPLRGNASFLYTKPGSIVQGNGVGYAFTIAAADQAKVLTISCDYQIASGTYYDGDLTFYIYDVTNGVIIQPSGFTVQNAGVAMRQVSTFQTASNSTSYRFIIHCAGIGINAHTVKFDNFSLGPVSIVNGTPVTDWTSYTPTGTWTTNTTYVGKWRRVGDSMQVTANIALTGAPTGSFTVNLPSGYTIDTTKISNTSYQSLGVVYATSGAGTSNRTGTAIYGSTTSLRVVTDNGATWSATAPGTFGNSDFVTVNAIFPILGWSSNVQMSSDTDTRVVSMTGDRASTQSVTNQVTNLAFTASKDTHGGWNGTQYVVQVPGDYSVSATVADSVSSSWVVYAYVNGTFAKTLGFTGSGNYGGGTATLSNLKAGDLISIRAGATTTVHSGGCISIFRLAGPSLVAANEKVMARYSTVAGQAFTAGTQATVAFGTKSFDTHGAAPNGTFTANRSGVVEVEASQRNVTNYTVVGNGAALRLLLNGSIYSRLDGYSAQVTGSTTYSMSGGDLVQVNAGDVLSIAFVSDNATTMSTGAGDNYVSYRMV